MCLEPFQSDKNWVSFNEIDSVKVSQQGLGLDEEKKCFFLVWIKTRRYGPLCGPVFSSCRELWPLAKRLCPFGFKKKYFLCSFCPFPHFFYIVCRRNLIYFFNSTINPMNPTKLLKNKQNKKIKFSKIPKIWKTFFKKVKKSHHITLHYITLHYKDDCTLYTANW